MFILGWKLKMKVILVQNDYDRALLGKSKRPPKVSMEDFEEMDLKTLLMIHLCLSNSVLREIGKEKTMMGLWLKLESL